MKFLLLFLLAGCSLLTPHIGGKFVGEPEELLTHASTHTQDFIKRNLPIPPKGECLVDIHSHIAGLGHNNSGIWVNPSMQEGFSFYKRLQFDVYLSASGVKDRSNADDEYVKRLYRLAKSIGAPIKLYILAFDYNHNDDGTTNYSRSTFYVPNDYVISLAKKYSDIFIPVASIHPYREDSLTELERVSKLGVKMVKWLPNAMNINPADPRSQLFFEKMRKLNMILLTHTGEEKAVDGEEFQKFGNPLLYRSVLEKGNKIIMAHVASLGKCDDIEHNNKQESCFDLFNRLFQDPKYTNNLYADLSAIAIHTRVGTTTESIIHDKKNHHRMINGSDYPLPAINVLYRTKELVKLNYLTKDDSDSLNEIYGYNPLLFDLLLKRVLKSPTTNERFSDSSYFTNDFVGVCK